MIESTEMSILDESEDLDALLEILSDDSIADFAIDWIFSASDYHVDIESIFQSFCICLEHTWHILVIAPDTDIEKIWIFEIIFFTHFFRITITRFLVLFDIDTIVDDFDRIISDTEGFDDIFFRIRAYSDYFFGSSYDRLDREIVSESVVHTSHFSSGVKRNRKIVDRDDTRAEVENRGIKTREMHEIKLLTIEKVEEFYLLGVRVMTSSDEYFFESRVPWNIRCKLRIVHKKNIVVLFIMLFEVADELINVSSDAGKARGKHTTVDSDFHEIQ
jgi:hypothetical protein